MTRIATLLMGLTLLTASPVDLAAQPASPTSRTFAAPIDRVWAVAESVLKSLGWDIDKSDRAVGWILTDSRGVEFKDYGVYGKGPRHKLRLSLKAVGEGRTSLSVERELYTEERILWMTERKPLPKIDASVEEGVLDAIQKSLP